MQFTGDDFFADKNICGIVLELPNSALGTNEVGLWARTLDKTGEGWSQADRGGRPLQAVFLPGDEREGYLNGEPADDDRFIGVFAHQVGEAPSFSRPASDGIVVMAQTSSSRFLLDTGQWQLVVPLDEAGGLDVLLPVLGKQNQR